MQTFGRGFAKLWSSTEATRLQTITHDDSLQKKLIVHKIVASLNYVLCMKTSAIYVAVRAFN